MARSDASRLTFWWPMAIALLASTAGVTLWLALESYRAAPWAESALNPSEAIVLEDLAQAMRRIEAGASATTPYPVRVTGRGIAPGPITPIEAAVRLQQGDMVAALLPYLSKMDATTRRRLTCLAAAQHDERSAEALNGGPLAARLCD